MNDPKKIFAISAHPLVLRGIDDAITEIRSLESVGGTTHPRKIFELPTARRPNIVVFDLATPLYAVTTLFSEIKAHIPQVLIVTLLDSDSPHLQRRAKRLGSQHFLSKTAPFEEFCSLLQSLSRGPFTSATPRRQKPKKNLLEDILTAREIEVLELLGQGFKTRRIAEDLGLSPKTIDSHCANLKAKLKASNGAELAHKAFQWLNPRR
jgi:DNA-binding NarL/FixJ family response regulator